MQCNAHVYRQIIVFPLRGHSLGHSLNGISAVSQIMKKKVVTLDNSSTVLDAIRVMTEKCVGCIVIMRGMEPLGILTERDALVAIMHNKDALSHNVEEAMSKPLITVDPETPVVEALHLMKSKNIRHLPVVSGGQLRGIMTIHTALLNWASTSNRAKSGSN